VLEKKLKLSIEELKHENICTLGVIYYETIGVSILEGYLSFVVRSRRRWQWNNKDLYH